MLDIFYASRRIAREPAISLAIVLALALGIGLNVGLFTVTNVVLFQLLPVKEPRQLVLLQWNGSVGVPVDYLAGEFEMDSAQNAVTSTSFSYPAFEQLRNHNRTFSSVCASANIGSLRVDVGGEPEFATVQAVSGSYYRALGVGAALGRVVTPDDDRPGANPVAVVSYDFWQREIGNPAGVGDVIEIAGRPFTIVGVAPRDFWGTLDFDRPAEIVIPIATVVAAKSEPEYLISEKWFWLQILGRLKPGTSVADAQHDVQAQFASTYGRVADEFRLQMLPGGQGLMGARQANRRPLLMLSVLAGLILLMTCAGVGALLMARNLARQRELDIRAALGAGRWMLVRPVLIESLVLASLGGVVGLLFANWSADILAAQLLSAPRHLVLLDERVVGFLFAVTIMTGFASGTMPALRMVTARLHAGAHADTDRERLVAFDSLIVGECAVAVALVVASVLMIRTLQNLSRLDLGFSRRDVQLFTLATPSPGGIDTGALESVVDRLRALPGVRAVGIAQHQLLNDKADRITCSIDGGAAKTVTYVNRVSGDFFGAMGIPVKGGRPLTSSDRGAKSAVATEAFVKKFIRDGRPLGHRVDDYTIVGVSGDTRYGTLREEPPPMIYVPFSPTRDARTIAFQIAFNNPGHVAAFEVRRIVHDAAPGSAVIDFTTPEEQVHALTSNERHLAEIATLFGTLALIVATLCIYASIVFVIGRRLREIATRIALGAPTAALARAVTARHVAAAAIGVVAGAIASIGVARSLRATLYGVTAFDLASVLTAMTVTLIGAVAACTLAASRAIRLDVTTALRSD